MKHALPEARPSNLWLLRLSVLALCGALAACQRPTQMLPPAPIFGIQGGAPVNAGAQSIRTER